MLTVSSYSLTFQWELNFIVINYTRPLNYALNF